MNLVAYESSDEDDEPQKKQQQQQHQQQQQQHQQEQQQQQQQPKKLPNVQQYIISNGKGKGKAPAPTAPKQPIDESGNSSKNSKRKKNRPSRSSSSGKTKKKKNKRKTVNALVLSPEIQAALARGDALGDSDSDEEAPDKKPRPKISRPSGSDPNDLLSLLPQPSTSTSADDILLKSRQKRKEAAVAKASNKLELKRAADSRKGKEKSVGVCNEEVIAAMATTKRPSPATGRDTTVAMSGGGKEGGQEEEENDDSDSDSDGDGGDDLLAKMRQKTAASLGEGSSSSSSTTPLFTLPSRAKAPPLSAAPPTGLPLPDTELGRIFDVNASISMAGAANSSASSLMEAGVQDQSAGQWGGMTIDSGQAGVEGGYEVGATYPAGEASGVAPITTGASYQHTRHQQGPYCPASTQAAIFGAAVQGGEARNEPDFGNAGGKGSRRKGRDMERALARGDLGALGNETPVMDLHQGSNEYNPLRMKPTTAAMNQDQKNIEGTVYDPRTGTTVKTLEPTSMQKRKHQINQLAVQAASMERDLMERSGASRLTKAQTHAKYGW